jgi:hypothetical protein
MEEGMSMNKQIHQKSIDENELQLQERYLS